MPDTRALDSQGQWKVAFDRSFRPYIYVFMRRNPKYIRQLNSHTVIQIRIQRVLFIHPYIRYVYIRRIYTYTVLANPRNDYCWPEPCIYGVRFFWLGVCQIYGVYIRIYLCVYICDSGHPRNFSVVTNIILHGSCSLRADPSKPRLQPQRCDSQVTVKHHTRECGFEP